jgi:hypothetical protein
MAGLRRCLAFAVFRGGVTVRSLLLVRRVRVILGLEVLGLVRGAFAITGHELSKMRMPKR